MEQTRPKTWHLHVDGHACSDAFISWCEQHGFVRANFVGHPAGYEHFEPAIHLTRKFTDEMSFRAAFEDTRGSARNGLTGYVEGEFIVRVIALPDAPYDARTFPFSFARRRLQSPETFRASELHLTFDADASDQLRVKQMLDAGLFGAYEYKPDGRRYLVLTAQGHRTPIRQLAHALHTFLSTNSGLVRARLKVEHAVAWERFDIPVESLPPIVDTITWH